MSYVVINVLTVPSAMREELERRFGARAGEVEQMDGFQEFELLRPVEGTDRYLVYTRWNAREDFERWQNSQSFGRGHAQASERGPAASGSEVWQFEIAEQASA